ncbi:MAG: lysis system i-spanin subunit Rz [Aeromonas sp.]
MRRWVALGAAVTHVRWQLRWQAAEQALASVRLEQAAQLQLVSQAAAAQVQQVEVAYVEKLAAAEQVQGALRADVAVGARRLRVAIASCANSVPADGGASVGGDAVAELATSVREDYFSLRAAIERDEAKLSACQSLLVQCAGRP